MTFATSQPLTDIAQDKKKQAADELNSEISREEFTRDCECKTIYGEAYLVSWHNLILMVDHKH